MSTSNRSFLTFHPGFVLLATEQLALITAHKFREFTAALITLLCGIISPCVKFYRDINICSILQTSGIIGVFVYNQL